MARKSLMRNEAPGGTQVAPTGPMTSRSSASPWERLQTVLLSLTPNETITVDRVVEETGLSPETVATVLEALEKAGLFERNGTAFVRRSLFQQLMSTAAIA